MFPLISVFFFLIFFSSNSSLVLFILFLRYTYAFMQTLIYFTDHVISLSLFSLHAFRSGYNWTMYETFTRVPWRKFFKFTRFVSRHLNNFYSFVGLIIAYVKYKHIKSKERMVFHFPSIFSHFVFVLLCVRMKKHTQNRYKPHRNELLSVHQTIKSGLLKYAHKIWHNNVEKNRQDIKMREK